jgi:protein-arginine kinase activator protein McsA
MSERRIMSQIATSNADFHPIIRDSKLDIDDKLHLQDALDNIFKGDFRAMIDNMLEHALEMEEYETAIVIRDELDKIDKK